MMNNFLFITSLVFLLSSCSNLNSNFDCPMPCGTRCESLDEVNARIDRGEIGRSIIRAKSYQADSENNNTYLTAGNRNLRYSETVHRLWIAPFEDKEGNYHNVSEILVVTESGKWITQPVKETDV